MLNMAATAAEGAKAVTEACELTEKWMLLLQALSEVIADWSHISHKSVATRLLRDRRRPALTCTRPHAHV